ncbi:MAG: hypothetical protein JOZ86_07045 [Candidatus Eremiobacteraeota bacterium]|nr:hypothetical protein [Candidatus Eremiobacteraeota bacterium]
MMRLVRILAVAACAATVAACSSSLHATTAPGTPPTAAGAPRGTSGTTMNAGQYPHAVLADGPVAYYRLGDTGAMVADSTGNGLTGSVSTSGLTEGSLPMIAGDAETGIRFRGVSAGHVTVPRNAMLEPANALTLEAWVKLAPPSPTVDQGLALYGVNGSSTPYTGYGIKYTMDRFVFKLALPSGIVRVQPSSGLGVHISGGVPYHLVATYDGMNAKLYVNGQLVGSQPASGAIVYDRTNMFGLVLGNNAFGGTPANAAMQEVAIYPMALSAARVAAHFGIGAPAPAPTAPPQLTVPPGFRVEAIANVGNARELAAAPNGDLLVGTGGAQVWVIPNAEGPALPLPPTILVNLPIPPSGGVAQSAAVGPNDTLYVATNKAVFKVPYIPGETLETSWTQIASVRTGPVAPNSDGDVHITSSVAVGTNTVYVGVGSSCNACTEADPTRATIQSMGLNGENMATLARRIRNPIALAVNPATGTLWAGGAGQDNLPWGHPYEYFDAVTLQGTPPIDYGWPACEENHHAYVAGSDCSMQAVPRVEFPAYSTLLGAVFYPANQMGQYTFPPAYRGGAFISMHGSWHALNGVPVDAPHVAYVPMNGDVPVTPVNWNDPTAQWSEFFTGFQDASGNRIGRTAGIAVGVSGSLFVADNQTGTIYRIRPTGT